MNMVNSILAIDNSAVNLGGRINPAAGITLNQ